MEGKRAGVVEFLELPERVLGVGRRRVEKTDRLVLRAFETEQRQQNKMRETLMCSKHEPTYLGACCQTLALGVKLHVVDLMDVLSKFHQGRRCLIA